MKKDNYKALASIILAAICGGGLVVFAKIGLRQIPSFSFTFFRFFIAFICMIPSVLRERQKIDKNILKVVLFSFLGVANVTLFAFGVRLTTATISQMLYTIAPVIVALFSCLLLKERISSKKITGLFFGLLGVLIIVLLPVLNKTSSFAGNFAGNLIILMAVLSYSFYTVLSKRFHKHYSSLTLTFIFSLITVIVLGPFLIRDYFINPNWIYHLSIFSLFSIFYTGVFGGAVYYFLCQYAIKHGSPVIASMTMYLQPISTFLWAFFLLSERLTLGIIIGGLLAIGGAWLVTKES